MKRKYFLLVILGLLSCWGCKKLPTEYYYLSDFEKSLAKFQVGSYWIYYNDSTLQTDSIYVTTYKNAMSNTPNDDYQDALASSNEYIIVGMKSTLYPDSEVSFSINAGGTRAFANYYFPTFMSYFQITNSNNEFIILPSDSSNFTIPHSTIIVNNTTYNSVAEILNTYYPYNSNSPTYTINNFVTSNAGLLKWNQHFLDSTNRSESWSLLRYHMAW